MAWCLITRHRIRTCFSEFIITNRTGSLPLILWAIPTPVGERVWIWLRPGLSLDDLLGRLDKIAVACWATAATAEAASSGNAAFIRLDLKRRDALTGTITSPLLEAIKAGNPPALRDPVPVPTALDLPQVTASEVTPVKPTPLRRPDPQDARSGARTHHYHGPRRHRPTGSSSQPPPGPSLPPGCLFPGSPAAPPPRREPQATVLTAGPEVPRHLAKENLP